LGLQSDQPGENLLVGRVEVRNLKNSFFNNLSTMQNSGYCLRILDSNGDNLIKSNDGLNSSLTDFNLEKPLRPGSGS